MKMCLFLDKLFFSTSFYKLKNDLLAAVQNVQHFFLGRKITYSVLSSMFHQRIINDHTIIKKFKKFRTEPEIDQVVYNNSMLLSYNFGSTFVYKAFYVPF